MIPYIVMLLVVIVCAIIEPAYKTPKGKRQIFQIALLPVFILIAFKSENVGSDTPTYIRMFNYVQENGLQNAFSEFDAMEKGYLMFSCFLTSISSCHQILFIALAVIVCSSLYHFISATANNRSLALLFFICLGFFQFSLSGTRQTIAICILLWAYPFIKQLKLLKFLLVVGLAMLFHKSAIIFAVTYFVANMKLTQKNIALMLASMVVIFFAADKMLLSAAEVMEYNYGVEETGNGYIFFAIVLLITTLCLQSRKILLRMNPSNVILLNVNFISLALWVVRLISRTAERVSLYFMPYTYVALEEYISSRPKRDYALYRFAGISLASILFIYRMLGQADLCKYEFCF